VSRGECLTQPACPENLLGTTDRYDQPPWIHVHRSGSV